MAPIGLEPSVSALVVASLKTDLFRCGAIDLNIYRFPGT